MTWGKHTEPVGLISTQWAGGDLPQHHTWIYTRYPSPVLQRLRIPYLPRLLGRSEAYYWPFIPEHIFYQLIECLSIVYRVLSKCILLAHIPKIGILGLPSIWKCKNFQCNISQRCFCKGRRYAVYYDLSQLTSITSSPGLRATQSPDFTPSLKRVAVVTCSFCWYFYLLFVSKEYFMPFLYG